jgi:hypothetical protein
MKTTLTVLVVLFFVALIYYRQRVYVRDPLATVYRNDVQQSGVEVFINYSNDVLLEQDTGPTPYRILVQNWNKMPGTPLTLTCLRWTACFTEAEKAPTVPLTWTGKGKYDPKVFMASRQVLFTDGTNAAMRIELR